MNRTELIIITTIILFTAFLMGWFACWLITRLTRPGRADSALLGELTRQLHAAEEERDLALSREADWTSRLTEAEAELQAALNGLHESRTEVEELRDYIERKLARR